MSIYVPSPPPKDPRLLPEYIRREFAKLTPLVSSPRIDVFTPTWTASGTQPALGNGVWTTGFGDLGGWTVFAFKLAMGSTTTFGSGNWFFSLPVPCGPLGYWNGSVYFYDTSAATYYTGITHVQPNGTTVDMVTNATTLIVGATSPFTWANGDGLWATVAYPSG